MQHENPTHVAPPATHVGWATDGHGWPGVILVADGEPAEAARSVSPSDRMTMGLTLGQIVWVVLILVWKFPRYIVRRLRGGR